MHFKDLSFTLPSHLQDEILGFTQNMKNWLAIGITMKREEPIEGYYGALTDEQARELSEVLLRWTDEELTTAQSLADDVISAINEGNELEAPTPNPNRFIKSSFTLSLLWVAKFYASLEGEYKAFSKQAAKAAECALDAYSALSWAIEPNGYLEDSAPITFDYLCFSC